MMTEGRARTLRAGSSAEPSWTEIVLTTIWRCAVAASAFYGLSQAPGDLRFLSQLGSLIAGIYFACLAVLPFALGGRRLDEPSPLPRMVLVTLMVIIAGVVGIFMSGGFDSTGERFEHLITPLLVVADYLFVGRNQANARLRQVFVLPVAPLAYVIFAVSQGGLYPFLRPTSSTFWPLVIGGLVGVLLLGLLMLAVGNIHRRLRGS